MTVGEMETRLRTFFNEHPVHEFGHRTVANYLGIDETETLNALRELAKTGFLKESFKLSPAARSELAETVGEGARR